MRSTGSVARSEIVDRLLEKYASGAWNSLSDEELCQLEREIEEVIGNPQSASEKLKQIALAAHLASLKLQLQGMKQIRDLP